MPLTGGARFISTQISAASEMRNAWFARLRGLTFLIVYFRIRPANYMQAATCAAEVNLNQLYPE